MTRVQFRGKMMIPSEEIGEYTAYSEKKKGYLFPLEEEGEYGDLPKYEQPGKWHGPEKYIKRERKPKVYASYAVSNECALHRDKLGRYERKKDFKPSPHVRGARASSAPPTSPSTLYVKSETRIQQERHVSLPPMNYEQEDELEMMRRLNLSKQISIDHENALIDKRDDILEYQRRGDCDRADIGLNLDKAGDHAGELGLSTALLREQRKKEETFMESTGTYLKEESLTSYVV